MSRNRSGLSLEVTLLCGLLLKRDGFIWLRQLKGDIVSQQAGDILTKLNHLMGEDDERHRIIHEVTGNQKAMVYQGSDIWRFS